MFEILAGRMIVGELSLSGVSSHCACSLRRLRDRAQDQPGAAQRLPLEWVSSEVLSPKETLNHFSDLRCGRCHKIGNFISPIASLWLSLAAGALSVPLLG